MTQGWPGQTGYDPTWRPFKGKTIFAPHPSSLETVQELTWPHAYIPVAPPAAEEATSPDAPAEAAPEAWPPAVAEAPPNPFVPDSIPSMRSPHPTFEPAIPPDGDAPPIDYTAYRVPTPIPVTPVGKLTALYQKTETPAPPRPKRRTRPWATRPAGMASIAGAIVATALIFVVVPNMLATPPTLKTMFTAPMLVLRAAGPGEITNVAVSIGQPVEPATVLLTLHAGPLSDAGGGGADQPIRAGVRGIVWSLDAQAGAKLQTGDPLAQLADCGRAFLVMQGAPSTLKAGQTVLIRMPGVRPFHGTVRPSAGVAEPPNTLVIDPTGFNAASPNACPVGATAEIQPETQR
jgi:hypothetical protein